MTTISVAGASVNPLLLPLTFLVFLTLLPRQVCPGLFFCPHSRQNVLNVANPPT